MSGLTRGRGRKGKDESESQCCKSVSPLVDHVVIIIKENHTYDNYFGTFPHSEDDNQLGTAQNPPPGDPDHRHETWIKRATEQRYRPFHPSLAHV
jgi:phospholipase C